MTDASAQTPITQLVNDQNNNANPSPAVDQSQQPQQQTQFIRPAKGEGSAVQTLFIESPVSSETPKEKVESFATEKVPNTETVKPEIQTIAPTNPQPQSQPQDDPQAVTATTKPTDSKAVVDMRTGIEKLSKVSPSADEITTIADKDEEEFIDEVLEHHAKPN